MDLRVLVMISGRGSNMRSLISNARNYSISAVLSNKPEAAGLEHARGAGIQTYAFASGEHGSVKAMKRAIWEKVGELAPDLIALAGFMLILDQDFVDRWYGKIINIHPSLLPELPGLGTHRRAIEAGHAAHGCSVHYVDGGVDTGPIIAQARLATAAGESEEDLAGRVLALEHRLYPWAVANIAAGFVWLEGRDVKYSREAVSSAKSEGFEIFGG